MQSSLNNMPLRDAPIQLEREHFSESKRINIKLLDPAGHVKYVSASESDIKEQLLEAETNLKIARARGLINLTSYIKEGDPLISDIASVITSGISDARSRAQAIYSWVERRIGHAPKARHSRVSFPAETILARQGTIEDRAVLAVALARAIGLEVIFIKHRSYVSFCVRTRPDDDGYNFRGKRFTPVGIKGAIPNRSEVQVCGPWIEGVINTKADDRRLGIPIPAKILTKHALYDGERRICYLSDEKISEIVTGDSPYLKPLAEFICRGIKSSEKRAQEILKFVQANVKYVKDQPDDAFQFPIETIFRAQGDCEDSALLFAALCHAQGIDVVILNPRGHIAVGVKGNFDGQYFEIAGRLYYYAETTPPFWQIGMIPKDHVKPARVVKISNAHNPLDFNVAA